MAVVLSVRLIIHHCIQEIELIYYIIDFTYRVKLYSVHSAKLPEFTVFMHIAY